MTLNIFTAKELLYVVYINLHINVYHEFWQWFQQVANLIELSPRDSFVNRGERLCPTLPSM